MGEEPWSPRMTPSTPRRKQGRTPPNVSVALAVLALLALATPTAADPAPDGWTDPGTVLPDTDYPSLVLDDSGSYLLFYEEMEDNNVDIYYRVSPDLESWSDPVRVTTHEEVDRRPRATVTRSGDLLLTFASARAGGYDIYVTRSTDGESWSDPARVTTHPREDWYSSVTELSDGTLALIFSSNRGGYRSALFLSTSPDGEAWTDPRRITGYSGDIFPQLVETDGEYLVLFARHMERSDEPWRGNEYELFLTRSPDLRQWSDLAQLTHTSAGHHSLYPALMKGRDNTLHLAFTSDEPGNEEVYVMASPDTRRWTEPVRLTRNVEYLDSINSSDSFKCDIKSLVQTPDGDIVIAYETSRGEDSTRFLRGRPDLDAPSRRVRFDTPRDLETGLFRQTPSPSATPSATPVETPLGETPEPGQAGTPLDGILALISLAAALFLVRALRN